MAPEPLTRLPYVIKFFNERIEEIRFAICSRNGWNDEEWKDFLCSWCKAYLADRGELIKKDNIWQLKP